MNNLNIALLSIVCFLLFNSQAIAGQSDLLVNKLVEKNIISQPEAEALLAQSEAPQGLDSLPQWAQDIKLKGDLRFRYQREEKDTTTAGLTTNTKRERARFRLRLGLEAKVAQGWTVKTGLASGSTDSRSTNQTYQDNFSSKPIQLDYAYAIYDPEENIKVLAGKIENKKTLWMASNLLWDSDINPEGLVAQIQCNENKFWLNTGYFILDEISAGADPTMFFLQPGFMLSDNDISVKGSFNCYAVNSVQGLEYTNIVSGSNSNTLTGSPASFAYDYDCWGISTEIGKQNFISNRLDYGAVFFDYINNPDPSSENEGYLIGIKFGVPKVDNPGDWQAVINYRKLAKDAWLDFLPNSTFLAGQTDARGYEYILQYAVAKNVSMAISYYNAETIKALTKEDEDFLLVDFLLKF
ncbi:MAG: putative porin [Candidatus Omnitrophica bacterium]|nr:putative porin [Candidatus Omnitrophota bacterium]